MSDGLKLHFVSNEKVLEQLSEWPHSEIVISSIYLDQAQKFQPNPDLSGAFRSWLQVIVLSQVVRFAMDTDQNQVDRLRTLADVLNAWTSRAEFDNASHEVRGAILLAHGIALIVIGEKHEPDKLNDAVQALHDAENECNKDTRCLLMTKSYLGYALDALGNYVKAVEVYQEVRDSWPDGASPINFAIIQNNLGAALVSLAEQDAENEVVHLNDAYAAYHAAWRMLENQADSYSQHLLSQVNNRLTLVRACIQDDEKCPWRKRDDQLTINYTELRLARNEPTPFLSPKYHL